MPVEFHAITLKNLHNFETNICGGAQTNMVQPSRNFKAFG